MIDFPYLNEICRKTDSKIVLLVVDGLGGLPHPETGRSELETAQYPESGRARLRKCLWSDHARSLPGITPGSGPGHLALFGYDPLKYVIGRGVLEALGIGIDLGPDDIASTLQFLHSRFQTASSTDRRAGRIPTRRVRAARRAAMPTSPFPGVEVMVRPVQDYRFVVVIRGDGLGRRRELTLIHSESAIEPLAPVRQIRRRSAHRCAKPLSSSSPPATSWVAATSPT